VVLWVGTSRLVVVGVAAAVLTLAAAFFLKFPETLLEAAVDLSSGFFRPGRLPGGGHYKLLGHLRDWLRRGLGCGLIGRIVVAMITGPPRTT